MAEQTTTKNGAVTIILLSNLFSALQKLSTEGSEEQNNCAVHPLHSMNTCFYFVNSKREKIIF